jgi:hypothetical protein
VAGSSSFFFSPEKSLEASSGWRRLFARGGRWVVVGGGVCTIGHLFGCLIECFVLILNLYIFLKMLRCQLVSGGQKIPPLSHDRMTTTLIILFFFFDE